MRRSVGPASFICCLAMGFAASAEDVYLTATGNTVGVLDAFKDCDVCPEMIVLPLGQFQMGSSVKEAIAANRRYLTNSNIDPSAFDEQLRRAFIDLGIDPDDPEDAVLEYYASGNINPKEDPQYSVVPMLHEVPAHQVLIDLPIAMGRNEVTREEWAACVADGGCEKGLEDMPPSAWLACESSKDCTMTPDDRVRVRLPKGPHATDPRSPMTGITFHEMNDYVSWLNEKTGADMYRLPTEAEWEYAARSGTTTRFAQGDTLSLDQANFSVYRREFVDGKYVWNNDLGSAGELLPVDRLNAANGWGLRHMSGNASEMTSTCGDGPHRGLRSSSEYLAADLDRKDCSRSIKGGMYDGNVELARPARRVSMPVDHWSPSLGFRVVKDLTPYSEPED